MRKSPRTSTYPIYSVQEEAGEAFCWPDKSEGDYYLHYLPSSFSPKNRLESEELLLITQTGIIVDEASVGPGANLDMTWIRVTNHVVMLDPLLANQESSEIPLLLDLGLTPCWLPFADEDTAIPSEELKEWGKHFFPAFQELAENPVCADSIRLKALEGWASLANWDDHALEVANQALADFANTSYETVLEAIFKVAVAKRGLTWEREDPSSKEGNATLFVGPKPSKWQLRELPGKPPKIIADIASVVPVRVLHAKERNAFKWPVTLADSFYLADAARDLFLLVRPASLQLFHKGYPVKAGDGFHFLRISSNVVVQMPAPIVNEDSYRLLIKGLGITIASVAFEVGDETEDEDESDWLIRRNFILWARSINNLWLRCRYFGAGQIHPDCNQRFCNTAVLDLWLSKADWRALATTQVIKALAGDLATFPEWLSVETQLQKFCANPDLDISLLKGMGQAKKTNPATCSLGTRFSTPKATKILEKIDLQFKAADDIPAWTLNGGFELVR